MTTRYRVEYALKTHRRDQFIEWIKGLLAVPFVLHSQPAGLPGDGTNIALMAEEAHRRYAEIMHDIELMIDDHIMRQKHQQNLENLGAGTHHHGNEAHATRELPIVASKLSMLVPSAGPFFTRLPLEAAFKYQDRKRFLSSRRFVAPSFNDVRLMLNSAQIMAVTNGTLQLATFDGDVTLYEDGQNLEPSNPIVPKLLDLLRKNIKIGIVTAAGYPTATGYYERLHGLLDAIATSADLDDKQKHSLVIMGGEANYLFAVDLSSEHRLVQVPREQWLTPEMTRWSETDIGALLNVAEAALRDCVRTMRLPARLVRKDRAVGIVPSADAPRIARECLEETVLAVQRILELSSATAAAGAAAAAAASPPPTTTNTTTAANVRARRQAPQPVPFCAFNGGRDVFVDIGDKSWGVRVCQQWFGALRAENTLHVGDQFLSAGANDFKARRVAATAWIASPAETVDLLDELADLMEKKLA